ncbi:MAG: hypothetical protein WCR42_01075 [bacterium]
MENDKKLPVLFLGHGSPMNAIEENEEINIKYFSLVCELIGLIKKRVC